MLLISQINLLLLESDWNSTLNFIASSKSGFLNDIYTDIEYMSIKNVFHLLVRLRYTFHKFFLDYLNIEAYQMMCLEFSQSDPFQFLMGEYQLETVPLSSVYVLTYKISHTLMGLVFSLLKYRCVILVFGLLHLTSIFLTVNEVI